MFVESVCLGLKINPTRVSFWILSWLILTNFAHLSSAQLSANESLANQQSQDEHFLLHATRHLNKPSHFVDRVEVSYLARSRGFSIEEHKVITHDQYVLTIHNLINPMLKRSQLKGVIILQHGILSSSSFYLMNSSPQLDIPAYRPLRKGRNCSTTNNLAFTLANAGYDVWLTNFRGSQYCRQHVVFKSSDPEYWDFNVDHLIYFDLKAFVDYVLEYTKTDKYTYIGHSLGSTVGLGALTVHKDSPITKKLSCSIYMAPVASTRYMRGNLYPLFRAASMLYRSLAPFPGTTVASFFRLICAYLSRTCLWAIDSLAGPDSGRNKTPLVDRANDEDEDKDEDVSQSPNYLLASVMQQAASLQMIKHIIQVHKSGRLSRFDYGSDINLKVYGSKLPPLYDLTKIDEPHLKMALVGGDGDAISTPAEVDYIFERVSKSRIGLLERIRVPTNPFNHVDMVLSKEAGKLVNQQIIDFIVRNKC